MKMMTALALILIIGAISTTLVSFIDLAYGEVIDEIYYENEYIINTYQCGNGDTAQLLVGFYDEYLTASMIVDYSYTNVDMFVSNTVEYETEEYNKFFTMIVDFHDRYAKC